MKDLTDIDKQFLQELSDLLTRYKAVISFACSDCSDTYGLTEDRIVIRNFKDEIILDTFNDWHLDQYSVKENT